MSSDISKELNDKILSLKQTYVSNLARYIERFIYFGKLESWSKEDRASLTRLAHNLVGSGETYGFPLISFAAKALEERLISNKSDTDEYLKNLIKTVDETIRNFPNFETPDAIVVAKAGEGKARILLIDDDSDIRYIVGILLARYAEVTAVGNATEGMQAIDRLKPDLILLDDQLPGLNGLDLMEKIQASGKSLNIPYVMLTATTGASQVIRGLTAGAADYITKPFDPADFVEKISNLLKKRFLK